MRILGFQGTKLNLNINDMNIITRALVLIIFSIVFSFAIFSCVERKKNGSIENKKEDNHHIVTNAEDFDNLVIVDSGGVTGADGVISFPFNDSLSIFMMGDSFLSPVQNKKRDVNSRMINNTFIVVNKDKGTHTALYQGTEKDADALLKPTYGNEKEYYWPGHGFEKNGVLHVFMSRFLHVDYDWGFAFSGTDYIRMDKDTFDVLSQEDFPYSNKNNVHYGHSIINEKDYTYLYGSWSKQDTTALHVARTTLNEKENILEGYEFFDGKDWVSDPLLSSPLEGIGQSVPEQFTVFKHKNSYILVMEARELGGGNIFSYIADTPTGPWQNEKLLYHTTEQENLKDQLFTYNAMAHPQYITDNKLLVSYCVNSFDVPKIHEINTDYYRPKFLWVPLEMILENLDY